MDHLKPNDVRNRISNIRELASKLRQDADRDDAAVAQADSPAKKDFYRTSAQYNRRWANEIENDAADLEARLL